MGRPIALLAVTAISIESGSAGYPIATVTIQVDGKPPSPLTLTKDGDTWCVSP